MGFRQWDMQNSEIITDFVAPGASDTFNWYLGDR